MLKSGYFRVCDVFRRVMMSENFLLLVVTCHHVIQLGNMLRHEDLKKEIL